MVFANKKQNDKKSLSNTSFNYYKEDNSHDFTKDSIIEKLTENKKGKEINEINNNNDVSVGSKGEEKLRFDLSLIAGTPEQQSKKLNFIPKPGVCLETINNNMHIFNNKIESPLFKYYDCSPKISEPIDNTKFSKKNEKFDYLKKVAGLPIEIGNPVEINKMKSNLSNAESSSKEKSNPPVLNSKNTTTKIDINDTTDELFSNLNYNINNISTTSKNSNKQLKRDSIPVQTDKSKINSENINNTSSSNIKLNMTQLVTRYHYINDDSTLEANEINFNNNNLNKNEDKNEFDISESIKKDTFTNFDVSLKSKSNLPKNISEQQSNNETLTNNNNNNNNGKFVKKTNLLNNLPLSTNDEPYFIGTAACGTTCDPAPAQLPQLRQAELAQMLAPGRCGR